MSEASSGGSDSGVVKHAREIDLEPVAAGRRTQMQMLIGPEDGATGFAMRRFVMGQEGGMPRHTNEVEHEQYVLAGRARISIGDRELEVAAGDVVFIPAQVPHSYSVLEAPFEFLCIVPNRRDSIRVLPDDS